MDKLIGISDMNGVLVTDRIFKEINRFNEGFALFTENGRFRFLERNSLTAGLEDYGYATDYFYGYAAVSKEVGGKTGFINSKSELKINYQFDGFARFTKDGIAVVRSQGKFGAINSNGDICIPIKYNRMDPYSEGLSLVEINRKCGYLNKEGDVVISAQWANAQMFFDGIAVVINDSFKSGCIDVNGNVRVPLKYKHIGNMRSNRALFQRGKTYGFLDSDGNEIIPNKYKNVDEFSDGLAPVIEKDRWGYINLNGDYVIEPKFDFALRFFKGFARVTYKGRQGLLNTNGDLITFKQFQYMDYPSEGLVLVGLE
ncbi:WG repeat-containing protein [Paenibacillus agaridevorans]|uniref:WG repeat-containing protein n=1 Tax=Paenibacillus agaridevorans TaxID=171404 RepID=UPI001BE3DEC4|nr:WG repeat-containing protein [Paenibacillus agaridevorans]